MPKRILPLSETKVRTAKAQEKEYKLFDGGDLFLIVTPSGGKLWHFKYRFDGRERKLTLGPFILKFLLLRPEPRKMGPGGRSQMASILELSARHRNRLKPQKQRLLR